MPPEDLGRDAPKSNVYSSMLILTAVFTLMCIIFAYIELKNDYNMFGGPGKGTMDTMEDGDLGDDDFGDSSADGDAGALTEDDADATDGDDMEE